MEMGAKRSRNARPMSTHVGRLARKLPLTAPPRLGLAPEPSRLEPLTPEPPRTAAMSSVPPPASDREREKERERNEWMVRLREGIRKRRKKERRKERKRKQGREIKKELFYLFLEIMIHKFYFVYYYYIMKNRI
jgi:hypothetical protein